jgi:hypothetical protein
VTYNRIGLSDSDKQTLKAEKKVAQARSLVGNLAAAANTATQNPQVQDLATRNVAN